MPPIDEPEGAAAPPPETVPPAPPAARANYVTVKPVIGKIDGVDAAMNAGRVVSLTAARAAEWADLVRPAQDSDLGIFSQPILAFD